MLGRRELLGAAGFLSTCGWSAAQAATPKEEGWVKLFNGRDLRGWYTMLAKSGKNVDPTRSVRVTNGMIHVLGGEHGEAPEAGYFATEQEYSNYHLRVEYKWGERRFAPRALFKRDNGILYHLTGPDRVWPQCVEFQIQESDVGDLLGVGGEGGQGGVRFVSGMAGPPGLAAWPNPPQFGGPNAAPQPLVSQTRKQGDFENRDGWNVLDLYCIGDRAAHVVNGRIVASGFDIQARPSPTAPFARLDKGRIALEVEYAETWFRKIDIRPLSAA